MAKGSLYRRLAEKKVAYYALTVLILFVFLFPFFWVIATSMKSKVESWSMPPVFLFRPTIHNYVRVLTERNFLHFIKNSLVVAVSATALALFVGAPAAFAFSRLRQTKRNQILLVTFLAGYLVPAMVIALPLYIILSRIGLVGTYAGVLLAHGLFTIGFMVWLLRGFFESIPRELEEAAIVDGCSYLGALIRIIMPVAAPGVIASLILCVVLSWNDFLYALVLTGLNTRTVPVAVSQFLSPHAVIWGELTAAGVIGVIPVVIIVVILQKWVIKGLTLGAVKE